MIGKNEYEIGVGESLKNLFTEANKNAIELNLSLMNYLSSLLKLLR